MTIANLVVLEDLKWEAIQRTGFEPGAEAKFAIGGASIAGVPLPLAGSDLNSGLSALNDALRSVGLRIEAPRLNRATEGSISMGPVRVLLADSPLGAQLLGPIIASARPILAPVFDALTDANKSLGLAGLVADIVLGVADGSGGAEVAVGGATAATSAVGFVAPTTPAAPVVSVNLPDTSLGGSSPIAGLPSALAPIDDVVGAPSISTTQSMRCALEAAPRRQGGCRDSNLAAALVIAGVAVAGLAAAEFGVRRRRRTPLTEATA